MEIIDDVNEQGKKVKSTIWRPYLKLLFRAKLPYFWIIFLTVIILGESTLTLMFPDLTRKIVGGNVEKAIVYGAVGVVVARVLLSGFISFISKFTMFKIDKSYRQLIWRQLMRSPITLFDKVKANEMVSRTSTDTAQMSIVFSYVVPAFISVAYMTVGTVAILFTYDWRLGMAQAIFLPMYIGFYFWYGRWSYKVNKRLQNKLANLTQFLAELLVNIPLIKTFVTEKSEDERGKKNIRSYYKASVQKKLSVWIEHPMTGIFDVVQSILVIGLGVYLVSRSMITMDVWVGYFLYVSTLYGILNTLGSLFIELKLSQGATSRIAQLVEHPEEEYERQQSLPHMNQDIVFDRVSFDYGEETVLEDVSFTIPHGKVTAIVGPSGGGKTTILSLIEQFYEPKQGSIKLGQTPIENYHLQDWRSAFGYVAQDIPLLTGTVRENLLYGVDREVNEAEIEESLVRANAWSFVQNLSEGVDTHIGENGSKLSGGQRQRLAIARVFLRSPECLLLDEATSNLDTRSEQAVQEAMHTLTKDRTSIVIAHDLATIYDADQIIVLEEGKISGIGTHEQLMNQNELYKMFVHLQLGKPVL
ncbi:MAG TPA: ABC transporter ATP-binding protein [Bacillota bacterium]|nr:ABC transporter ATP-binding protein [Bacillota bacterium]